MLLQLSLLIQVMFIVCPKIAPLYAALESILDSHQTNAASDLSQGDLIRALDELKGASVMTCTLGQHPKSFDIYCQAMPLLEQLHPLHERQALHAAYLLANVGRSLMGCFEYESARHFWTKAQDILDALQMSDMEDHIQGIKNLMTQWQEQVLSYSDRDMLQELLDSYKKLQEKHSDQDKAEGIMNAFIKQVRFDGYECVQDLGQFLPTTLLVVPRECSMRHSSLPNLHL